MNIEEFREWCLSFEGASEKMPFGKVASEYDRNVLVFEVAGKWFCFVNIDVFDFCCIKCDPDRIGELQAQYEGATPGYHMNKRHWISLHFDKDIPDAMIRELVRQSYDSVVASLPKKEREALKNL